MAVVEVITAVVEVIMAPVEIITVVVEDVAVQAVEDVAVEEVVGINYQTQQNENNFRIFVFVLTTT